MRRAHSVKLKGTYFEKKFSDKISRQINLDKQGILVNKFIKSYYNEKGTITILSREIKPDFLK